MAGVIVVVDLHAAEVDQPGAAVAGLLERGDGRASARPGTAALPSIFSAFGCRLPLLPGLGQADRIEDADRDVVALGGAQDLWLARVRRRTRREN